MERSQIECCQTTIFGGFYEMVPLSSLSCINFLGKHSIFFLVDDSISYNWKKTKRIYAKHKNKREKSLERWRKIEIILRRRRRNARWKKRKTLKWKKKIVQKSRESKCFWKGGKNKEKEKAVVKMGCENCESDSISESLLLLLPLILAYTEAVAKQGYILNKMLSWIIAVCEVDDREG